MFKRKKKGFLHNKIFRNIFFRLIILIIFLAIVFLFFFIQFDLWRFTFLKKEISLNKIEYIIDNNFLNRDEEFRYLDYYLNIFLSSKDNDFKNKKIIYILNRDDINSSVKIYIIKYLKNFGYLDSNLELNKYLSKLGESNLKDYYLKIFLLKNFSDLNEDKNMIEYLKNIFLDNSLSVTQRKAALRSLWTTFNSGNLSFFYKQIIQFNNEKELKKEALKALSSLSKEDNVLLVSDLDMYKEFLNSDDYDLEKICLFLLSNYYFLYPKETKEWLFDKKISSINNFLANELFK
ncbi:hypothetical protein EOL94_03375 [bacterium]|nr:hypothetical protein [bacterium]